MLGFSLNKVVSGTSNEASTITHNLLHEIQELGNRFTPQSSKWAEESLDTLRFVVKAGEGLTVGMVYLLYTIHEHWDDLPLNFRKKYNLNFDVMVVNETPVKPETLDNYFRAVRTFFIEGKKPFGAIEIPKRDKDNHVIIQDGEIVTEVREFNPVEVPITKLTLMRSAVENDQMDEDRWKMLVDPGVTPTDIKNELYTPKTTSDPDPSMVYGLYGDVITVSELGREVVVGRFDFSAYGEDELVTNGINRLAKLMGMRLDLDMISAIKEFGFLERATLDSTNETKD